MPGRRPCGLAGVPVPRPRVHDLLPSDGPVPPHLGREGQRGPPLRSRQVPDVHAPRGRLLRPPGHAVAHPPPLPRQRRRAAEPLRPLGPRPCRLPPERCRPLRDPAHPRHLEPQAGHLCHPPCVVHPAVDLHPPAPAPGCTASHHRQASSASVRAPSARARRPTRPPGRWRSPARCRPATPAPPAATPRPGPPAPPQPQCRHPQGGPTRRPPARQYLGHGPQAHGILPPQRLEPHVVCGGQHHHRAPQPGALPPLRHHHRGDLHLLGLPPPGPLPPLQRFQRRQQPSVALRPLGRAQDLPRPLPQAASFPRCLAAGRVLGQPPRQRPALESAPPLPGGPGRLLHLPPVDRPSQQPQQILPLPPSLRCIRRAHPHGPPVSAPGERPPSSSIRTATGRLAAASLRLRPPPPPPASRRARPGSRAGPRRSAAGSGARPLHQGVQPSRHRLGGLGYRLLPLLPAAGPHAPQHRLRPVAPSYLPARPAVPPPSPR